MIRKRNIITKAMQILIISALLLSCEKVSQLSDYNTIEEFSIENVSPGGVILQEPVLQENSIEIPVVVGKYLFPITIKPVINFKDDAVKVIGLDNDGKIEFESSTSVKSINIVSQSGMTRRYEIKLKILPSKESSEIIKFKIISSTDNSLKIGQEGFADPTESKVTLFAINPSYPLSINPLIVLSEGAIIDNWTDGGFLTFSLQGETKKLNVLSESGRKEEWSISVKNAISEKNSSPEVKSSIYQRMNYPFHKIDAISEDDNLKIDTLTLIRDKRIIQLFYSTLNSAADISVKLNFQLNNYLTSAGVENNEVFNFSSNSETKSLFIIDNITGVYSEWSIILRPKSTYIEVNEFNWNSYSSQNGKITIGPAEIDKTFRTINIPILSLGEFPLLLNNTSLTTNNSINSDLPINLLFNSLDDIKSFSIVKNGVSETWKIKLENRFISLSNSALVLDFIAGKPSFSYTIDEVYIEPSQGEIVIISENFIENTSLKIIPIIKLSEGAVAEGIISGGVIEIKWGKPFLFKVRAEDGTTQPWSIIAIPAPQLPNSDLEDWWIHPQFNSITSTIYPSDGSGWNSSNNPNVLGVSRSSGYNSQYSAQISTTLSTINFADIIKVTSLTAGNLFLGKFRYSTLASDVYNPLSMIIKGIPFNLLFLPRELTFMYKYKTGDNLVRTPPKTSSTTIPAFNPIEYLSGSDFGEVKIEMWENDQTLLTASGTGLFTKDISEWTQYSLEINANSINSSINTNYISVSFTSSVYGDKFTGADGSILVIDKIRLIYHIPGVGSIKVK